MTRQIRTDARRGGLRANALLAAFALTAVAACAPTAEVPPAAATAEASTRLSPTIEAFRDICLANAPSFAGSAAAAKAFGIGEVQDLGFMSLGSRSDNSLAVQITAGSECVITTPSQSVNLGPQFASLIPGASAASFPVAARIGSETFVFMHDRSGGEAFVMLKK